ncbi:MAG: class I SAM-dependent methyltransferase, partial [Candidatus Limnocylindria bacterium]
LTAGDRCVDVGCGEGKHALALAERFALDVTGVDPVPRHIELANERLASATDARPELAGRVRFEIASANALPLADGTVHLVWCRDVLVHVADLDAAYAELRRVLRKGGRALVYQSGLATDRLETREAEWLWKTSGVIPASADPVRIDDAIAAAGFHVDRRIDVGAEWGEWSEEHASETDRHLVGAARLLRAPERYVARFGRAAYDIMLADRLWHVYHMIGKLEARVYLMSRL